MVLTGFAVLEGGARADALGASSTSATSPGPVYAPGFSSSVLPNGNVLATNLATFTRWDGAVLPYAALNQSSGNWSYLLSRTLTSFTATRMGLSFTQALVPGANYSFQLDRIKETIVVSSFSTAVVSPSISVAFSSTYGVSVSGTTVTLVGYSGPIWTSAPFLAWDSAKPAHTWANVATSVSYTGGALMIGLDVNALSGATYPLYIDPTWVVGGSASGWGASTFANATTDLGDGSVKLGYFADNFNNNAATGWTTNTAVTFSGGTMNLASAGTASHSATWSNRSVQFDVNFARSNAVNRLLQAFFCYSCSSGGDYELDIDQKLGAVTLFGYSFQFNIGLFSTTISFGTTYTVQILVHGNFIAVYWNGVRMIAVTDPNAPGSVHNGGLEFVSLSSGSEVVSVDNVRVWNANAGSVTTPARDAGTSRPLQTETLGTVDAYDQIHVQIRSNTVNSTSGAWTNVKADVASGLFYNEPNQTQLEFYQLQITLTSGTNATPVLTQISTLEGTVPAAAPTANTGFEPWHPYVGGMANLVSGNLYDTATDLSFQGKGFTLAITRAYNSALASQGGPFGLGWTYSYGQSLTMNANGNVTWNGPDGSSFLFVAKGTSGGFSPPAGVPDRLIKNGDGTFTLWMPSGRNEHFSSTGSLLSMTDRNGNSLTLTYSTGKTPLLTTVADATGKALTFAYDKSNRIITVTDPAGRTATYTYATSGGLQSYTDPLGNKWQYTYYGGTPIRLEQIVDPVGKSILVNYDVNGKVTSLWLQSVNPTTLAVNWQFREYTLTYNSSLARAVQNARNYWTTVTLNPSGNPVALRGPSIGCTSDSAGNSSVHAWDGEMNRIMRKDGRQDTWSMTYGFRANLLTTTDPGLNVSAKTWLEVNNATNYFVVPSSAISFRGFTSTNAYDWKGNLLSTTDPGGNTTRYAYDASGFLNRTVTPGGNTTWFVYNASGWLVKKTDALNDVTQYAYDGLGRRTSVTDPLTLVTTTAYDADSRVVNVTDPLRHSTLYGYDSRGDLTSVTDPDGLTTTYTINVTNSKDQVATDAGGNHTTYTYDFRNNLVAVKDAGNHTTSYAFDAFDRLTAMTTPLGHVTSYAYDAAGNRIRRTDGNGATTTYTYDKLTRVAAIHYPGSPVYPSPQTLTFAYDADGDLTSATGFGYTETRTYDRSDRLWSASFNYGPFIATVSYTYNKDGYRASLKDSSGSTTAYAYDAAGRLKSIQDPEALTTTFFHDRDSRGNLTALVGGVKETVLFDQASRLTAIYINGSSGTMESLTYTYDSARYQLTQKDVVGATTTTTTYVYDREHRLNKTTVSGSTTYDRYDAVGNLVAETLARTETLAYDADNELTTVTFSPTVWIQYQYDRNGNQVSYFDQSYTTANYYYDYENRLIGTSLGCNFTYAPTGERITSTCGGATTYYGYDLAGQGAGNVVATYNGTTFARMQRFTHADRIDSPVELYAGGTHYAYEVDALGTVKRITSATGGTVNSYTYDAWGNPSQTGTLSNPFEFTAREWDSADSLYFNRARYYNPSANAGHRFTSKDPAGMIDGPNQYGYTGNNPVNRVDPTGRAFIIDCYPAPFWPNWILCDVYFIDDASSGTVYSGWYAYSTGGGMPEDAWKFD